MSGYLGDKTPLPDTLNFVNNEYYLGIRIGSDSEMKPRKKIGAVPLALDSYSVRGATLGTVQGSLVQLGSGGKMDVALLPTGTSGKKLVLANSALFDDVHTQDTDTGTDSLIFNIGSGSTISGNDFDLTVSSASNPPALRYSGTADRWQLSNDGTTFTNIPLVSDIHDPVTLAGAYDYLTLSDQEITLGQINLATDVTGTLPIASGGTNAATIGNAGSIAYSAGTAYGFNAVGTAGQVLVSAGAGTPIWGTVAGGVITPDSLNFTEFMDAMTLDDDLAISASASNYSINFDSDTLYLDTENNRVGIGTASPGAKLDIAGSSDATQLIVRANSTQSNTNPLIQLLKSDGTVLSAFHSDNPANVFLGVSAGMSNTTSDDPDYDYWGTKNTFIGSNAGYSNTTAGENTAVGFNALYSQTDYIGGGNVAVGSNALYFTTDCCNTAVGMEALYSDTTGALNTAVGYSALYSNTEGFRNTAVGYGALMNVTSGNNNTAYGSSSGNNLTTGSNNIIFGYQAGDNLTTGSNNIIIGYDIDAQSATGSNQLNIGNAIYGDLSTGSVGIGDTSPDQLLEILSSGAANTQLSIGNTNAGNYDSQIGFELVDGTNTFTMGVDDSDSDKFKISTTGLGTNDRLVIDSSGYVGIGISAPNNYIQVVDLLNLSPTLYTAYFGYQAGRNVTGGYNVAVGYQALSPASSGSGIRNVAVGYQALDANTSGGNNVAIGIYALKQNTTASGNTAVGDSALFTPSASSNNTAIGTGTLQSTTSGNTNTAVGAQALLDNTQGTEGVAVGYSALRLNTTGNYNTGIGTYSLYEVSGAYANNTAVGHASCRYNQTGSSNTCIGFESGRGYILGSYTGSSGNILIGFQAGKMIANNSLYNTAIGYQAGYSVGGGDYNVFIGNQAGYNETGSNKLYVDNSNTDSPLIYGDFSSNILAINGNVGIGTSTTSAYLTIKAGTNAAGTAPLKFTSGTNLDTAEAGAMEWNGTNLFITQTTGPTRKTIAYTTDVVSDHGALTGLTDDDHSIYALLAGRASGQTLIGGTGTTDDLILKTTSGVGASGADMIFQTGNNGATEAMRILYDGKVGIGTASPSTIFTLQGANSVATLGSEQITNQVDRDFSGAGNWTGTGWSIVGGTWSHTAGANAATLDNAFVDPDPVAGNTYQIVFTVVTNTAGTLTPGFGGTNCSDVGQVTGTLTAYTCVVTAANANALSFTPDATWVGTLDNISVILITPSNALATLNNSNGTAGLEIRSGGAGLNDSFIGYQAGRSNTTGFQNSAMGTGALYSNTTGFGNSVMGYNALTSNTTGGYNSAMGISALQSNTTGNNNSAMGANTLLSNTTGFYNSAMGANTLVFNTTGSYNSAMGMGALQFNTTGWLNSAVGNNALNSNTTGSQNTALGQGAGRYQADGETDLTDPENSVYLGYGTRGFSNLDNNSIVIGYNAIGIGENTVVLGNDSIVTTALKGNVGIGTATPGGGTGSSVLTLADSSAPPTALAGTTHLYSSAGEGYWMDAAGNAALQTPHDLETGKWIFSSTNVNTERILRVEMEDLTKKLDIILGGGYVSENGEPYYTGENLLETLTLKTGENVTTISELKISTDKNLAIISQNINDLFSADKDSKDLIADINSQLAIDSLRMTDLEDLTAELQVQMDELKKLNNQELNAAQIEANKTDIDYIKMVLGFNGSENPGDIMLSGKLEADDLVAGTLTIKIINKDSPTIGTAVIKAGETSVDVKTKAVNSDSKIFVTISQADKAVSIKTGNIKVGESFAVQMNDPVASDIGFDWWIIESK